MRGSDSDGRQYRGDHIRAAIASCAAFVQPMESASTLIRYSWPRNAGLFQSARQLGEQVWMSPLARHVIADGRVKPFRVGQSHMNMVSCRVIPNADLKVRRFVAFLASSDVAFHWQPPNSFHQA